MSKLEWSKLSDEELGRVERIAWRLVSRAADRHEWALLQDRLAQLRAIIGEAERRAERAGRA